MVLVFSHDFEKGISLLSGVKSDNTSEAIFYFSEDFPVGRKKKMFQAVIFSVLVAAALASKGKKLLMLLHP